jgi:hypothetical protein
MRTPTAMIFSRQFFPISRLLPMLCLMGIFLPLSGYADSIRIGHYVVVTGDSQAKVLQVAGQPESRKHVKADPKHKGKNAERWVYRVEKNSVEITLCDEVVTKITTRPLSAGDQSKGPPSGRRKTSRKSSP